MRRYLTTREILARLKPDEAAEAGRLAAEWTDRLAGELGLLVEPPRPSSVGLFHTPDLAQHCREVTLALTGEGYQCTSIADEHVQESQRAGRPSPLAQSDVLVGLVGHVYGPCLSWEKISLAESAFKAAVEANKPRMVFLAPESYPIPANLREDDTFWERQRSFRVRLARDPIRDTFTSVKDLVSRVLGALRFFTSRVCTGELLAILARLLPLPPFPHFVHPYPLQDSFTGRVRERQRLTNWLQSEGKALLSLTGKSGSGKSALTWVWVQRDVLEMPLADTPADAADDAEACRVPEGARPDGILWWSFYESGPGFQTFLDRALVYASRQTIDPTELDSPAEKVRALVEQCSQRRLLIVLDGFERQLDTHRGLDVVYHGDPPPGEALGACSDPAAALFLRSIAATEMPTRVLLVTRSVPQEIEGLAACDRIELASLDEDEAMQFLASGEVRLTRSEMALAREDDGYRPLGLRLLRSLFHREHPSGPPLLRTDRQPSSLSTDRILSLACEGLEPHLKQLLCRLSVFRSPVSFEVIQAVLPTTAEGELRRRLKQLVEWGLVFFDEERKLYDQHPLVRKAAYALLQGKEAVHTRMAEYFHQCARETLPASLLDASAGITLPLPWSNVSLSRDLSPLRRPAGDSPPRLERLTPLIECYHHTACAGRYDEAFGMYVAWLAHFLHQPAGSNHLRITLLLSLFPDGEDHPPRVSNPEHQAWVLNELANAYSRMGQGDRAAVLRCQQIDILEQLGRDDLLAIALINQAHMELLPAGELARAAQVLLRGVQLAAICGNPLVEAAGRLERGQLLACEGAFVASREELHAALDCFTSRRHREGVSVAHAYLGRLSLLMHAPARALEHAREALVAARDGGYEADRGRAETLLAEALAALAADLPDRSRVPLLDEAERHVAAGLDRCRRIAHLDLELRLMLVQAELHRLRHNLGAAVQGMGEALEMASRGNHRLRLAEIHLALARVLIDAGDLDAARRRADSADNLARCDGAPHCHRPLLDEAERLARLLDAAGS